MDIPSNTSVEVLHQMTDRLKACVAEEISLHLGVSIWHHCHERRPRHPVCRVRFFIPSVSNQSLGSAEKLFTSFADLIKWVERLEEELRGDDLFTLQELRRFI